MTPTERRRVRLVLVLLTLVWGLFWTAIITLTVRGDGLPTDPSALAFTTLLPVQILAALVALRWRRSGGVALLAVGATLLLTAMARALAPLPPGVVVGAEWPLMMLAVGSVFAVWPLLAGAALLALGAGRGRAQRLSDAS